MVGAALRAVLVSLLLLGDLSSAFMFPDEWRAARAAAALRRPRLAVGSDSPASPERTTVSSQAGLEPAASHLWSAASYYPRWPDHIHRPFLGSLGAYRSGMREQRQVDRPPLVQARHQRNNPYRQREEFPESLHQHRRPLATSLWRWT